MSDFFEPPPPAPEPPRYSQPPWVGPPRGTLPGVVAVELLLAQTDKIAVYISRVAAYPSGFEFDITTITAPGDDEADLLDPMMFGPRHRGSRPGSDLTSDMLRLGVQFADGGKATNTSGFHHGGDPPAGPVMHGGGGGGGGGRWQQTMWVWPLPPPGPIAFVCEWPSAGVPLSRQELDAQTILDAAARARVIFSDEDLPERPSSTWTSTHIAGPQVRPDSPPSAEAGRVPPDG